MAKGPGWYDDPWGGTGLRWWDGSNWTEHVQGEATPGYGDPVTLRSGPLVVGDFSRRWYYQWWFIALMLLLCCWPAGLILVWMRPATPVSMKAGVTVAWLVLQVLLALAIYAAYPEAYTMSSTG